MTDRQALIKYRIDQANTTLADARIMLQQGGSPRSVINRSYYAVFYMVLALFLKSNITLRTSKHSGVIGMFDKHFVSSGLIPKEFSRMLHNLFDDRQEFDYKELSHVDRHDAATAVDNADKFISFISSYIEKAPEA